MWRISGRTGCAWALIALTAALGVMVLATPCHAQALDTPAESDSLDLNINFGAQPANDQDAPALSEPMKIVLLLSVMTLIPSILLTMTSFTRIVIVLSFVRRALSTQSMPPNQILIGLSLFLTVFIMSPVITKINAVSIQPALNKEITTMEALKRAETPIREFMLKQTRKKDLALFAKVANVQEKLTRENLPFHVLLPAFALSEIKTAFQMGFIIYLPMLVVDMVVATLLVSMGMFMLPPMMVSLPLKVLLFILVDGWGLVIGSLAQSFL